MSAHRPFEPVLRADAEVPQRLADILTEAALIAAHDAGAASAHHDVSEDLDALLRELMDRDAPSWVVQRVDEIAQQHLDAGDELGENADRRLDVLEWLRHRDPIDPAVAVAPEIGPMPPGGLRLVPRPVEKGHTT